MLGKAFLKAKDALKGVAGPADKTQGLFTGMGAAAMKSAPGMALPATYFAGAFGKDLFVDPVMEQAIGPTSVRSPYAHQIQQAKVRQEEQKNALRFRLQSENTQRRMVEASMRLAATDPHLYNEVMAGRSLPTDAVVFGGQPRTDLMEELAMGMAQDQFKQPQSAHNELMQELGV